MFRVHTVDRSSKIVQLEVRKSFQEVRTISHSSNKSDETRNFVPIRSQLYSYGGVEDRTVPSPPYSRQKSWKLKPITDKSFF